MIGRQRILDARRGLMIVPAVLALAVAGPSLAEVPSLSNIWSINPTIPFVQGLTTQTAGPLTTSVSGSYTYGPGASMSGVETDTANYGHMFASGSGTSLASPGEGSGFDIGNSTNTWIGSVVSYRDVLTIDGPGPVTIGFDETFNQAISFTPSASGFTSDFLFVTGGGNWSTELDASGSSEHVMTFNPGDQVVIAGYVSGGCSGGQIDGSPPGPPTVSCSFQGSNQLFLQVMTPGGGYVAASGTKYAVAPASNGVPEPAAWALMIAGFGLSGAALRRRRAVVA